MRSAVEAWLGTRIEQSTYLSRTESSTAKRPTHEVANEKLDSVDDLKIAHALDARHEKFRVPNTGIDVRPRRGDRYFTFKFHLPAFRPNSGNALYSSLPS